MSKQAGTYFIEEVWERYPKKEVDRIGHGIRGIYVLLEEKDVEGETKYNVIYIGLSTTGMRGGRLTGHAESKSKEWTHFSAYKVFDNITDEQIKELEGLFRTIFRADERALKFNKQRKYGKFKTHKWKEDK